MSSKRFYVSYDKSTPNWTLSLRLKDPESETLGSQIATFNSHALHLNLGGYDGAEKIAAILNKQLEQEKSDE